MSLGLALSARYLWSAHHTGEAAAPDPLLAYGQLPLAFVPNEGGANPDVRFVARSPLGTAFLTRSGAVFALKSKTDASSFRMRLLGGRTDAEVTGEQRLPGEVNELLGNDRSKWRTHLPVFGSVRYRGVYPGVDLLFHGSPQRLEYDFEVAPGADPSTIRVQFDGADDVHVDDRGDLVLSVDGREVRQGRPIIYQWIDGERRAVDGAYVLRGAEVAFALKPYDVRHALVIDPVLQYSTYLGGTGTDNATALTIDSTGAAYVAGYSRSTDFPTVGGYQTSAGGGYFDAFVAKLSPTGALVYATYLGGTDADVARGIAVDAAGGVFLTGYSRSNDFPRQNSVTTLGGAQDSFITRLDPSGATLAYSTYLGGAGGEDDGNAIALDSAGNAYVTGLTYTNDFPKVNAVSTCVASSTTNFNTDAWLAKLSPAGAVLFSRCVSGARNDIAASIAVDSANVYVVGSTESVNFPIRNGWQPTHGGTGINYDSFFTRFNPEDAGVEYSTFLGGSVQDMGKGLALDSAGNVYLGGHTYSADFPTQTPVQSTRKGTYDAFAAKFWADGGLAYSTYLGGVGDERAESIVVDGTGNAYLTGSTTSTDFPTVNPVQASKGANDDAFVAKLNASGSAILYSTFLGGSGTDLAYAVARDSANNLYVTGYTDSPDFALRSSAQATYRGGPGDAFLTKLDVLAPQLTSVSPSFGSPNGGTAITLNGSQFAPGVMLSMDGTSVPVSFVNAETLNATTPPHAPGLVGLLITNSDGRTAYLDGGFQYVATPVVSAVSAPNGPATGGTSVTITGSNFEAGATVTFGGDAATSVNRVDANTITAVTPAHAPGSVTVVVTNPPGVNGSKANAFIFDPPPTVSGVSPLVGPASGGTTLDITGANFVSGAVVRVGGVAATNVTFMSSGRITATSPAHAAATVDVVVQNPDGQIGTRANGFTYEPPPSVNNVMPTFGSTAGGTPLTLQGINFKTGATVTVGGAPATAVSVNNANQITATSPAHAAGIVDIVVTNPDGQPHTYANSYEYIVPPVVTQITPVVGPVTGGRQVTITGSGFVAGTTLQFGTAAATGVVVVDPTHLTAFTPAHVAGAVDVIATVPPGLIGPPLTAGFTFLELPTVSSVTPTTGSGSGGTAVTITGTNFFAGAVVYFGGVVATNITVVNPTTITAITPAHGPGPVNVVVTNPDGQTAQLSSAFVYSALAPVVQAVSPNTGPIAGGTVITVSGSSFVTGATVTLDGVSATNVAVQSDTVISAVVPAHASGAVEVRVTNPDSQTGALANGFTYLAPPAVISLSPSTGPASGGTTVTLTGTEFRNGATVLFGSSLATVAALEANAIVVTSPSHAAGTVDVVVTNSDGQQSGAVSFVYVAPPAISSLSPNIGTTAGGTAVTVTGTGFVEGATLRFGEEAADEVKFVDSTTLTAITPSHGAGRVDVMVHNPDGQSGTAALGYEYSDLCSTCQKPVSQYAFGCSTGAEGWALGWLLVLILPALRRRRR